MPHLPWNSYTPRNIWIKLKRFWKGFDGICRWQRSSTSDTSTTGSPSQYGRLFLIPMPWWSNRTAWLGPTPLKMEMLRAVITLWARWWSCFALQKRHSLEKSPAVGWVAHLCTVALKWWGKSGTCKSKPTNNGIWRSEACKIINRCWKRMTLMHCLWRNFQDIK